MKIAELGMYLALVMALCACGKAGGSVLSANAAIETAADVNLPVDERKLEVLAGSKRFTALLYANAAAEKLAEKMPLTLDMSELHGNEKYFYLPDGLPEAAQKMSAIHAGDIMLFGSDCLVLFYKDFQTTYSYTPIGRLEDVSGLAETLGGSGITVTFERMDE